MPNLKHEVNVFHRVSSWSVLVEKSVLVERNHPLCKEKLTIENPCSAQSISVFEVLISFDSIFERIKHGFTTPRFTNFPFALAVHEGVVRPL